MVTSPTHLQIFLPLQFPTVLLSLTENSVVFWKTELLVFVCLDLFYSHQVLSPLQRVCHLDISLLLKAVISVDFIYKWIIVPNSKFHAIPTDLKSREMVPSSFPRHWLWCATVIFQLMVLMSHLMKLIVKDKKNPNNFRKLLFYKLSSWLKFPLIEVIFKSLRSLSPGHHMHHKITRTHCYIYMPYIYICRAYISFYIYLYIFIFHMAYHLLHTT